MKKFALLFISLFLLTACSSNKNYQVSLNEPATFTKGQATFLSFQITDNQNEPVTGLQVKAGLEMVKMDHGTTEVSLQEEKEGIYEGKVELPMEGEWQVTLELKDGNETVEKVIDIMVEMSEDSASAGALAAINGDVITQEDIDFYKVMNEIQIEMYREHDKNKYEGDELEEAMKYWDAQFEASKQTNTLLTQIIRLEAAALLAEEKGFTATNEEINQEINEVRKIYRESPAAMEIIQKYGEEKFWDKQHEQYKLIVLTSKVQEDVLNLVKQANPEAETKEINMLAQKKYEELLVSQVSTLNVEIF
jgi:hypothetical protein